MEQARVIQRGALDVEKNTRLAVCDWTQLPDVPLTPEQVDSWGWRVPFWISIVLLVIAFKARMALEETPVFLELSKNKQNSEDFTQFQNQSAKTALEITIF